MTIADSVKRPLHVRHALSSRRREALVRVDERGRRADEGKTYIYLNRIDYLFFN